MQLQLWRNATLLLTIENKKILVDPMLGDQGSLGTFPWTNDLRLNPLVPLPFSDETLSRYLDAIDAVLVTHLHPDHWDEPAINMLNKQLPVLCPDVIAETIFASGFENVIAIKESIEWNGIGIFLTQGRHGTGEIGERMGRVSGFILRSSEGTLYLAGDTIWCSEVSAVLESFNPNHVILAGGAATFSVGGPVTMTFQDIDQLCKYAPRAMAWVTHLETISTCHEDRAFIREKITRAGLLDRCFVMDDGQIVQLPNLHLHNSIGC
jgi:L-ascorbate metabolism protein UlaG (beta-lactamase superfamily)